MSGLQGRPVYKRCQLQIVHDRGRLGEHLQRARIQAREGRARHPRDAQRSGKLDQFTRVFALADRGAGTARFADTNTFATAVRLAEQLVFG